ncbi:uncharacterized protein EDB91DRAFT_1349430 [Suillus paluster]|uniref:uncharacterized protein n=1 Tax=Suillus paluster TaxID=48578 RepID=UPI001B86C81D|nr:uncharacterized protein EDB91DRAFT_1349430 [Suillus paluster]KAG1731207.1 hypothetical protein EDB91DRAFT_1349430 [Suillus paluster]
MPLIQRFNASHEHSRSRLLSTARNKERTEEGEPWCSGLLEETQAALQRLRRDSDFTQDNIFRFSAPFFTFACVLASFAAALRRDMMPSPHAMSLGELSLGILILAAGVLLSLAVLRAIIWSGALAIDAFLLMEIENITSPQNERSKLNQRSILFSGLFS